MEKIKAKTILQKNKSSDWFGNDYNMNLYRGCKLGYENTQLTFF